MDKDEAIKLLKRLLRPGDTVYTVLRGVSQSGMTRWIDAYVFRPRNRNRRDADVFWLSPAIAAVTSYPLDRRKDALKVGGVGMDMGFAVVYDLSYRLFPKYRCIGENCPSNDHVNPPHYPRERGSMQHEDGYALNQKWVG